MDFLIGLFFIVTTPVFYIWGAISFIRWWASRGKERPDATLRKLREQAASRPDMTLVQFLADLRAEASAEIDAEEADEESLDAWAARELGQTPRKLTPNVANELAIPARSRPSARAESPQPTPVIQPTPRSRSLSAVNIMAYLGAFLIIAAVSLFVSFQWQTFSSITRFAVVLGFTLAWYGAGSLTARVLKLENLGLIFITLGALLTPFCGLAFQNFVINSDRGVGITWLLTSLIGTAIYLWLSYAYRRRYFTYFANLSILSMVLSLVQISDAPAEFFILTGALTGLLLLGVRIAIARTGVGADFYATDVERSSLGVLVSSVVLGLLLVPVQEIPFYSVEVLAVLVTTVIYAWVYLSLRLTTASLASAELLTVFAVSHALATFGVDFTLNLYLSAAFHLGQLYAIERVLGDKQPQIVKRTSLIALVVTGFFYMLSLPDMDLTTAVFVLVLIAHASYDAVKFERRGLLYIAGALWYFFVLHLLSFAEAEAQAYMVAYALVGVAQIALAYAPLPAADLRRPGVWVGFWGLALTATGSLAIGTADDAFDGENLLIIGRIVAYLALLVYGVFAYTEWRAEERILPAWVHYLHPFVGGLLWFFGLAAVDDGNAAEWIAAGFALATGILWGLAYLNRPGILPVVGGVLSSYLILAHLLAITDAPLVATGPTFALLSIGWLLVTPVLPEKARAPRTWTVLIVLALVSMGVGAEANTVAEHLSGWVASYTALVILYLSMKPGRLRDYLLAAGGYVQYAWHIVFLSDFVNPFLFQDPQWWTASAGTVFLLLAWRDSQREARTDLPLLWALVSGGLFILPTLGQISDFGLLVYFLLGIAYSLAFVAGGVYFRRRIFQQIGAASLVAVVLFQTGEFLLGIPRWVVVGLVGFGLIGGALFLALRTRGESATAEG